MTPHVAIKHEKYPLQVFIYTMFMIFVIITSITATVTCVNEIGVWCPGKTTIYEIQVTDSVSMGTFALENNPSANLTLNATATNTSSKKFC